MFALRQAAFTVATLLLILPDCLAQFTELDGINDDTYSVHYSSNGVIWIGGDGKTWKSTDYGNSIVQMQSNANTDYGNLVWGTTDGIYGLSATHAFMTGYFFLPNDAIIFETNTGDGNWTIAYQDNLNFVPDRWTSDIDKGLGGHFVVVGSQGRIITSSDSGANWALSSSGTTGDILQIEHAGNTNWLAAGGNFILRSANDGTTWTNANFPGANCSFLTEEAGTAFAGTGNVLYTTTDAGLTWNLLPTLPFSCYCLEALSANKLIASGQSGMYVSTNGGNSWETLNVNGYQPIFHMSFYDENNGIGIGSDGYTIKTTNGGGPSYPIADFSYDVSIGCVDSLFHFTNETVGNYTYQWVVNGISVSTSQNLDYAFSTTGTQTVKLIATNANGSGEITQQVSTILSPTFDLPVITLSNDSVCPNGTFTVTIQNPIAGVTYKAINNGTLLPTTYGNSTGSAININLTANSTVTETAMHYFGVQAYKTNECATHYEIVNDSILIVLPPITTEVYAPFDTICGGDHPSHKIFQVFNSNVDFSYRWYHNSSPVTASTLGNGDTLTMDAGNAVPGIYTYNLKIYHNELNCVYNNNAQLTIVSINDFFEQPLTTSYINVGETLSFDHAMNYTQYTWDFTCLSDAPVSHLAVPPPFTYNIAGRDTLKFYAQIDQNNSCHISFNQVIDVIDTLGLTSYPLCASNSSEMGALADYILLDNNIGYSISTKPFGSTKRLIIRKYDAAGNILVNMEEPTVGSTNIVEGRGIAVDEDGNMYISFVTTTNSAMLWNTEISAKYVLAKINSLGELIWYIGSNTANWGKPILVNDHLVLSGYCDTGITIVQADGTNYTSVYTTLSMDNDFGFIITVDTSGQVIRDTNFGKRLTVNASTTNYYGGYITATTNPPIMCLSNDGNVLVNGLMNGKKQDQYYIIDNVAIQGEMFSAYNVLYPQVYTLRYNPLVGVVSAFSPALGLLDLYDVTCLDNGKIIYSGAAQDYFDTRDGYIDLAKHYNLQLSTIGNQLYYLQCTDSVGHSIWEVFNQKTAYNNLDAYADNQIAAFGGYALEGSFLGTDYSGLGANSDGASDCVLATFNEEGALTNAINIASPGANLPIHMLVDECGNARVFHSTNISNYSFPFNGNLLSGSNSEFKVYDLGNCSPECVQSSGITYLDASIETISLNTTDPYASNTRDIFVNLSNHSVESIESIEIVCEIDGEIIDTLLLSTTIAEAGNSGNLPLMTHTFSSSIGHKIKLWIHSVNGSEDLESGNDTLTYGFVICNGPLSGTYTIGHEDGIFNSVSLAALAIDTCGVSGPVEFLIADGYYEENFNFSPGDGMSNTNRVTFKSASENVASVILSAPYFNMTSAEITINDLSQHYVFEDLTFQKNVTNNASFLFYIEPFCNDIHIENCQFIGPELSSTVELLRIDHRSDGIHVLNNTFTGGARGLRHGHPLSAAVSQGSNSIIAHNTFTNQSRRNLEIFRADSILIDGNSFHGKNPNEVSFVLAQSNSNYQFVNNIFQQTYYNWPSSIESGSSGAINDGELSKMLYFYNNNTIAGQRSLVANNIVTTGAKIQFASCFFGGSSNVDIIHNTLFCLLEMTSSTNNTIQNNILGAYHASYFLQLPAGSVTVCDHNQFDSQFDTNTETNKFVYCNTTCGTGTNLTQWQSTTGFDIHSIIDSASYFSENDLHISQPAHIGSLTAAALMPLDIDGQPRNLLNPTVGADEPADIPFLVHLDELIQPTCANPDGGTISVSVIGGEAPYNIMWNDGSTLSDRTALLPGTYTVTITDSNSESTSATFEINELDHFEVHNTFTPHCNGTTGQITTSVIGTYTFPLQYQWSNMVGGSYQIVNTDGSYHATVIDANGCTAISDTVEVNLGVFSVELDTLIQSNCTGSGSIEMTTLYPYGDVLYIWNYGLSNEEDFMNAPSGPVNLIAINGNNCAYFYSTELLEQLQVTITDLTTCFDGTNGILNGEITGGQEPVSYSWNNSATTIEVTNLNSGTYILNATDALGCTISESYTFTNTPPCGCTGDVDSDGVVGISDLLNIMSSFGCIGNCEGDLNEDYAVGAADIIIFMQLLGTSCE